MRLALPFVLATLLAPPSERRREARRIGREVVRRNQVVFTFDDGPHRDVTPVVLDALREHGVRAAFFACGIQLQKGRARAGRALLRREIAQGHLVGTHTVHHPHLSRIGEKEVADEIGGAVDLVERATGRRPTLFRPPFGEMPPAADTVVDKRGLGLVLWTTSVRDYEIADAADIAGRVLEELERRGGGVVLLHDTHAPTADALPLILDGLSPLNERRAQAGLSPLQVVGPQVLLGQP